MNIALIITAAGRSLRFGEDKLSFPFRDTTVGEASISVFSGLSFSDKVIVVNSPDAYIASVAGKYNFGTVLNPTPQEGLSRSVHLGLDAVLSGSNPDGIMFATADMPFLKESSVSSLLALFQADPDHICLLASSAHFGKPVIFPRSLYASLYKTSGDTGGKSIVRKYQHTVRTVITSEAELSDIDTKNDLGLPLSGQDK